MDKYIEKGYYIHSQKLGEGGFGLVKLATHLLTKQKVAIKIIDKEKIKKDLFRVYTEITALKGLRHKNIAKLYQIIENEQFIYLIMEYCSGGELFDYLVSRSRLSETESRRIILQLVSVLAFIHSKGFAHRDIKPENILLDENQNIKLIDFGLCASSCLSSTGNLDGLSTCCGSPAYVAPELLMGAKYSGPAADIWSTGVLLYALLTGRLPFNNPNLSLLYKSIKEGNYEMPKYLTCNARDLISKMLCIDPQKRITVQGIIEHRWMSVSVNQLWPKTKNILAEILKEDESELDEKILLKCSILFPSIDLNTLRNFIKNRLGYHCATYWLVKQKPESYQDFDATVGKEAVNRRRSRSFSEFNNQQLKKITKHGKENIENNNHEGTTNKQPVETKRIKADTKEVFATEGKRMPSSRVPRKPICQANNRINRKLFGTPIADKKLDQPHTLSPILPPQKNFAAIEEIDGKTPKKEQIPEVSNHHKLMTPKRSLFQWLKETTTPRKTYGPRRFSVFEKNSLKNYIMTNYTNVDQCIEKIIKILESKKIICTAKNYNIRCVLSTMNVIILAFELEVLVCRNSGSIALHHKRIRGTSWDYVKMCDYVKEELNKKFENENI